MFMYVGAIYSRYTEPFRNSQILMCFTFKIIGMIINSKYENTPMIAKLFRFSALNIMLHTTIKIEKIPMNKLEIQKAAIAHSSLIDVESIITRNKKIKYKFSITLATLKILGSSLLGRIARAKIENAA